MLKGKRQKKSYSRAYQEVNFENFLQTWWRERARERAILEYLMRWNLKFSSTIVKAKSKRQNSQTFESSDLNQRKGVGRGGELRRRPTPNYLIFHLLSWHRCVPGKKFRPSTTLPALQFSPLKRYQPLHLSWECGRVYLPVHTSLKASSN